MTTNLSPGAQKLLNRFADLDRASVAATRIAAMSAIGDNPENPVITVEHLRRSFGVVLRGFEQLLSDFSINDAGGKGASTLDRQRTAKRAIRELLDKNRDWRKVGGVPRKRLYSTLLGRTGFRNVAGRSKLVTETLDAMIRDNSLRAFRDPNAGEGRKGATYLAVNKD